MAFDEAFERFEPIMMTIGLCSFPAAISSARDVSSSKSLSPYSLKHCSCRPVLSPDIISVAVNGPAPEIY